MRYAIPDTELAGLEAACGPDGEPPSPEAALELAWHLRQRDSARALRLLQVHGSALQAAGWRAQARAQLVACEAETLFGRLVEAEHHLQAAREALAGHREPLLEGDALLAEAGLAKAQGDSSREVRALAEAGHPFVQAGDFQRLGITKGLLAGERVASRATPSQAESSVPADGSDDAVRAVQLAHEGLALWLRDPQQVAEMLPRAAELALRMGLVRLACVCTFNAGNMCRVLGEVALAAVHLDRALRMALATGWPGLIATTQVQAGALLRDLGRPADAHRLLETALGLQRGLPAGPARASACSELAETLLDLKRGAEAAAVMAEAVALYRGMKARINLPAALLRQARALSLTGRESEARALIDEAQSMIDEHGYAALGVDACLALAHAHRRGRLPSPPGLASASPTLHFAQAALAAGRRIRGWRAPASLLTLLADAWAEAGDHARAFEVARLALDERGRVADQLLGQSATLAGLMAIAQGGPGAHESAPAPGSAEASPLRAPEPAEGADGLTPREREVLALLARGYSNKDIAATLGLSGDTVKWHLKNLFGKLGAHSRRHVLVRARMQGLLAETEEPRRERASAD